MRDQSLAQGRTQPREIPERETCGAWMPLAKEHCARRPGHARGAVRRGGGHRTRYALDNNRYRPWFGVQQGCGNGGNPARIVEKNVGSNAARPRQLEVLTQPNIGAAPMTLQRRAP